VHPISDSKTVSPVPARVGGKRTLRTCTSLKQPAFSEEHARGMIDVDSSHIKLPSLADDLVTRKSQSGVREEDLHVDEMTISSM
jgi:hypothetical protein